jgi:hypothetical protein
VAIYYYTVILSHRSRFSIFQSLHAIAVTRQFVPLSMFYNLVINTATFNNWITYLFYFYFSFGCNMMNRASLLVCNTFHFVLVVFGTCPSTIMLVCALKYHYA